MAAIGEPFESADFAFAFRTIQPPPAAPRALLVLLQGVEGDESQLAELADGLPGDVLVVFPRAYRAISGGRCGWYRVGISNDGLQVVVDEEVEARGRLIDFLAQLQKRYDVPPKRTVVAGFSQGGMLALAAALTDPKRMAAVAVLGGRLIDEVDGQDAPAGEFGDIEVLLVHGRSDATIPVEDADLTASRLAGLGIRHEVRLVDGGHEVRSAALGATREWLGRVLSR